MESEPQKPADEVTRILNRQEQLTSGLDKESFQPLNALDQYSVNWLGDSLRS